MVALHQRFAQFLFYTDPVVLVMTYALYGNQEKKNDPPYEQYAHTKLVFDCTIADGVIAGRTSNPLVRATNAEALRRPRSLRIPQQ